MGYIKGKQCNIAANDATVKVLGSTTLRKPAHAEIAMENQSAHIYLVDSAGAYLSTSRIF
jgi:acetyl-CoA carboxylase carboxyltransferase component